MEVKLKKQLQHQLPSHGGLAVALGRVEEQVE
jgi:hypothetical protein